METLQLLYMQNLTNMAAGIRGARAPVSPSKNKCNIQIQI